MQSAQSPAHKIPVRGAALYEREFKRQTKVLEPDPATRCLARNALVPIVSLVVLTLAGIFWLGYVGAVAGTLRRSSKSPRS